MTREELIAYDKWLTRRKWGTGEIISPERAADIYLAEHSLPPAEGAEAIVKKYEDEYDFKFHWVQRDRVIRMMREFAAQPQPKLDPKKVQWSGYGELGNISQKPLQPTAEGAEQRIRVRNILQDFYRRGEYELEQAEEDIMRLFQQQPTAEGAEEILESIVESLGEPINIHNHIFEIRPYTVEHKTEWWIFHKEVGSGEPLAQWLQNFATLHAQRIADKMVEENLVEFGNMIRDEPNGDIAALAEYFIRTINLKTREK